MATRGSDPACFVYERLAEAQEFALDETGMEPDCEHLHPQTRYRLLLTRSRSKQQRILVRTDFVVHHVIFYSPIHVSVHAFKTDLRGPAPAMIVENELHVTCHLQLNRHSIECAESVITTPLTLI